jgi:hypothetical protein
MRGLVGLLGSIVVLALTTSAWAKGGHSEKPSKDCHVRYDLGGMILPDGVTKPEGLSIDGRTIDLAGWCKITGLRRKVNPSGVVQLSKSFKGCGPLRAGRVRAALHDSCNRVYVNFVLRKPEERLAINGLSHVPTSTFHTIEDRVLSGGGCAVSTCHGSTRAGNLDLRPGAAYASLVGVAPDNAAARAKGLLRVKAGDVAGSFLSAKVHGTLAVDEGSPMPLSGNPLTEKEIALIDAWIAAGAPETAEVPGVPELPPLVYQETPPLAPPANGYQLVLEGPTLGPREEQEGCLWLPSPTATDVPIQKYEIALNPGTHHFVIWQHSGSTPPPVGQWLFNDVACLGSGGNFGQQIAGAPHAPYYLVEQRPGFATLLPGGGWYGMNAHYYNESSAPIQMKVWVNFYPFEGTPEHVVKMLPFDLSASGKINVPVDSQVAVRGRYTNSGAATMYLTGIGGHMHKRGVRFTAWTSDGAKVLEDFDWAHPAIARFDPPHALPPGDFVEFECLHDNGVTRPLHRDLYGNPSTIVFGTSAEDEMCILTGQFYDD